MVQSTNIAAIVIMYAMCSLMYCDGGFQKIYNKERKKERNK